ncbi:MFS general substrate transporter [Epithele typhae]|uniref:MFS general substrate transporter n=1 Tax=Epithele typhae TaxID=378194 RepID=UPI002007BCE9|nr:MFS general substrate transporter [Epithele typhae]KAH9938770.1 MFS general substrate transporter [Epithele typhae]
MDRTATPAVQEYPSVELTDFAQESGRQAPPPRSGQPTPLPSSGTFSAASSQAALRGALDDGPNVQELAPVDGGVQAWTFCACAFILEMMIWGYCFSYGIFQDYYTTHAPFDRASSIAISAVGTTAIGLQYAEALIFSCFFSRYPDYMMLSMWCGLGLSVASIFASSFATQVWQLILLQGVAFGVAGGLLYAPVLKLLPEWFSARRGLAGGIIFAGGGVGGELSRFIFPFVWSILLDKLGLQWTLRLWALLTAVFCGFALLGIHPRLPVPKFTGGRPRPRFIPLQLGFASSPLFWSVSLTLLLQGFSYFPVSLYIASFARRLSSPLTATVVLSVFNSSAVAGQVILGHLSDRFPYPWVMFCSALGSSVAAFLLWGLASGPTPLYLFAIIFGALSGGFSSTWTHAAFECARGQPEHTGIAWGGTAVFKGVSAVGGPILSSVLLDLGGGRALAGPFGRQGFGAVEVFVGACALATALGSLAIAAARRRAVVRFS